MGWACLSEPVLCCLDTNGTGPRIFHDEYHQSLLLLVSTKGQQVFQIRLPTSEAMRRELSLIRLLSIKENALWNLFMGAALEYAQLSRDSKYLVIQKSDIEIVVVHLQSQLTKWILCCRRPGNQILCNGLRWIGSSEQRQELLLITKYGVEHYIITMPGADSKGLHTLLHRIVRLERICCFWFNSMHDTLLVSCGNDGNELICYLIHSYLTRPCMLKKLPRLRFTYTITPSDIYLASMYGELHVIYSDSKRNSTKLLVYLISATNMTCIRALTLLFPSEANLIFSVIDNLLICHSLAFHVSSFYDIKCEGMQGGHEPFCPPLPASFKNYKVHATDDDSYPGMLSVLGRTECFGTQSEYCALRYVDKEHFKAVQEDVFANEKTQVLSAEWNVFAPLHCYRLNQTHQSGDFCMSYIEIRWFCMDLTEITKSSTRNPELVAFLLRRGSVNTQISLIFNFVHSKLGSKVGLDEASDLLSALRSCSTRYIKRHLQNSQDEERDPHKSTHSSYAMRGMQTQRSFLSSADRSDANDRLLDKRFNAEVSSNPIMKSEVKPSMTSIRRRDGSIVITQEQVAQSVWHPLSDHPIAKSGLLSMYLCEYLKVLHYGMTPVDTSINVLCAQSFIVANKEDQLHVLLKNSVITDSLELAQLLVDSPRLFNSGKEGEERFTALIQEGLDMYQRLGELTLLVKMLLELGRVEDAMKSAMRYENIQNSDVKKIPVHCFYDALCTSVSNAEPMLPAFHLAMKFNNLLQFLRRWDAESLKRNTEPPHVSALARNAKCAFPKTSLPEEVAQALKNAFGL